MRPRNLRMPLVTDLYAPRPLWNKALTKLRRTGIKSRSLRQFAWYEQLRRPHGLKYQFHAWARHSQNHVCAADDVRSLTGPMQPADPPRCEWCLGPREAHENICAQCLDAVMRRDSIGRYNLHNPDRPNPPHPIGRARARYARPAYSSDPLRRLRDTRGRPVALGFEGRCVFVPLRPRKHTRALVTTSTMRYLTRRRNLARKARALGMEPIRPGVWFDRQAEIVYLQTSVDLRPAENIVYAPHGL